MTGRFAALYVGALAAVVSTFLLTACVDTELGLDATIDDARVEVAGTEVAVELDITYRVGTYAEGVRLFQPSAIDLFVEGALVASLTPSTPPGFVSRLEPGQVEMNTFRATVSDVADAAQLCGDVEVTVLFRWLDVENTEFGMTEVIASNVSC